MSFKQQTNSAVDQEIQLLRMKRLVKELQASTGSGTSMISLYIPPGNSQLIRVKKLLVEEYGVSVNIKSRV